MEGLDFALRLLDGGADVALIAIAYCIWKLDRRVYRLELLAVVQE